MKDEKIGVFTAEALFVTLTNVNFDPEAIVAYIRKTAEFHDQLHKQLQIKADYLPLENTIEGLIAQGKRYGINADSTIDPDLHSLQWIVTYGLKGIAAYAYHAYLLGKKDQKVFDFIHEGLVAPFNKVAWRKRISEFSFQMRRNQHTCHGVA